MQVAKGKRELEIHCSYAQEGDDLMEILLECFRTFLYKEIQKSAYFDENRWIWYNIHDEWSLISRRELCT